MEKTCRQALGSLFECAHDFAPSRGQRNDSLLCSAAPPWRPVVGEHPRSMRAYIFRHRLRLHRAVLLFAPRTRLWVRLAAFGEVHTASCIRRKHKPHAMVPSQHRQDAGYSAIGVAQARRQVRFADPHHAHGAQQLQAAVNRQVVPTIAAHAQALPVLMSRPIPMAANPQPYTCAPGGT